MKTITPSELHALREKGVAVDLIDVRTPVEFREMHAEYARNVPLDQLEPQRLMEARNGSSGEPLYVMCRSGNRGEMACKKFIAEGYEDVVHVDGGALAWEQAQLPIKRGKKAVSLERQVRIAAGFLVLLGVVLGFTVHPGFFGISGFVGAGLVFAGVTDTCAMGMLIAKMPWNQVRETCEVS